MVERCGFHFLFVQSIQTYIVLLLTRLDIIIILFIGEFSVNQNLYRISDIEFVQVPDYLQFNMSFKIIIS